MARTVRGYAGFNKSALMKGLTVHVKRVIIPEALAVLKGVADKIVTAIDLGYIPEYLGNLHDATGCAVYNDGMLAYFRPTSKHAVKNGKSGFDGVNHYDINGSEFLQRTVADAAITFSSGLWFVVISAVPYAYHINEFGSPKGRGIGFFKKTYEDAVNEILAGLRPIASDVSTSIGTSI